MTEVMPFRFLFDVIAGRGDRGGQVSQIVGDVDAIAGRAFSVFYASGFGNQPASLGRSQKRNVRMKGNATHAFPIGGNRKRKIRQREINAAHHRAHRIAMRICNHQTASSTMIANFLDHGSVFDRKPIRFKYASYFF